MNQFLRFCLIGALGFVTDFTVLYAGVTLLGLGTISGRIVSFIVAATTTWKANRHFTFAQRDAGSWREWMHYLLFTSVGGGINVAIYQTWVWMTDKSTLNLFIGVAAGSGIALVFNFMISKYTVFANRSTTS